MRTLKSIFTFILVLTVATNVVTAQTQKVNTEKSSLKWLGKKVGGQHNGAVKISGGELTQKDGKITAGNFTIDMTSITVEDLTDPGYNAKLVGHLKSEDFFSVDKFNTATFKVTKVAAKKGEGSTHEVTGDLTIKGITNSITFPANITLKSSGYIATAKFKVDRAKYDVRYGSTSFFDNIQDKAIENDIEFDLYLVSK